ncbi:hypothetical protein H4R33_000729 [Dimargaris cristalligena]|nr:hypothetical protein H4R33_000729 [Dimargaris cristalligena]
MPEFDLDAHSILQGLEIIKHQFQLPDKVSGSAMPKHTGGKLKNPSRGRSALLATGNPTADGGMQFEIPLRVTGSSNATSRTTSPLPLLDRDGALPMRPHHLPLPPPSLAQANFATASGPPSVSTEGEDLESTSDTSTATTTAVAATMPRISLASEIAQQSLALSSMPQAIPGSALSQVDLAQHPPIASLRIETALLTKEISRFRACDDETMACFYCREWAQWVYRRMFAARLYGGDGSSAVLASANTSSWIPANIERANQSKKGGKAKSGGGKKKNKGGSGSNQAKPAAAATPAANASTNNPDSTANGTPSTPTPTTSASAIGTGGDPSDPLARPIDGTAPGPAGAIFNPRQCIPTAEMLVEKLRMFLEETIAANESGGWTPLKRSDSVQSGHGSGTEGAMGGPSSVTSGESTGQIKTKSKSKGKSKAKGKKSGKVSGSGVKSETSTASAKTDADPSASTIPTADRVNEYHNLVGAIIDRVAAWYSAVTFPLETEYEDLTFDKIIKMFPIEETEDPTDPALLLPALQVTRPKVTLPSEHFPLLGNITSELISSHTYPACQHNNADHPNPAELETQRILFNEQIARPREECRQSFYSEMNPVWQITYLLIRSVQRIEAMRVRLLEKGCASTQEAFQKAHQMIATPFQDYWANAIETLRRNGQLTKKGGTGKKKGGGSVVAKPDEPQPTAEQVDILFRNYLNNLRDISLSWCKSFLDNYYGVARDFVSEFESILKECIEMCQKRLMSLRQFPRPNHPPPSPSHSQDHPGEYANDPADPGMEYPTVPAGEGRDGHQVPPPSPSHPGPDPADQSPELDQESDGDNMAGFIIRDLEPLRVHALQSVMQLQPKLEHNIERIRTTVAKRNERIFAELDAIWEDWVQDSTPTLAGRLEKASKKEFRRRLRAVEQEQQVQVVGWSISAMETLLAAKDLALVCIDCLGFLMAEAQQLEKAVIQAFVQKWSPTTTHYLVERQDIMDDFTEGLLTGREELAGIAGKLLLKEAWRILETNISRERQKKFFAEQALAKSNSGSGGAHGKRPEGSKIATAEAAAAMMMASTTASSGKGVKTGKAAVTSTPASTNGGTSSPAAGKKPMVSSTPAAKVKGKTAVPEPMIRRTVTAPSVTSTPKPAANTTKSDSIKRPTQPPVAGPNTGASTSERVLTLESTKAMSRPNATLSGVPKISSKPRKPKQPPPPTPAQLAAKAEPPQSPEPITQLAKPKNSSPTDKVESLPTTPDLPPPEVDHSGIPPPSVPTSQSSVVPPRRLLRHTTIKPPPGLSAVAASQFTPSIPSPIEEPLSTADIGSAPIPPLSLSGKISTPSPTSVAASVPLSLPSPTPTATTASSAIPTADNTTTVTPVESTPPSQSVPYVDGSVPVTTPPPTENHLASQAPPNPSEEPLSLEVLHTMKTQVGQWSKQQVEDALLALIPERVQLMTRVQDLEQQLAHLHLRQAELVQVWQASESRAHQEQQHYEWQLRQLRMIMGQQHQQQQHHHPMPQQHPLAGHPHLPMGIPGFNMMPTTSGGPGFLNTSHLMGISGVSNIDSNPVSSHGSSIGDPNLLGLGCSGENGPIGSTGLSSVLFASDDSAPFSVEQAIAQASSSLSATSLALHSTSALVVEQQQHQLSLSLAPTSQSNSAAAGFALAGLTTHSLADRPSF